MISFEEKYKEICSEISKRRSKWTLKAVAWMDFDDVKQMIAIHINKKWHLWDQSKAFLPWVNKVITHQITNMLRNLYLNIARPCVSCHANEGDDRCRIYEKQCANCPLYAKWEKGKKMAYNAKLPVSIENHQQETSLFPSNDENMEDKVEYVHRRMKEVLTPIQYRVYKYLYIDGLEEKEVAVLMQYRTSESGRSPGYKQIQNMVKIIIPKAEKIILTELY